MIDQQDHRILLIVCVALLILASYLLCRCDLTTAARIERMVHSWKGVTVERFHQLELSLVLLAIFILLTAVFRRLRLSSTGIIVVAGVGMVLTCLKAPERLQWIGIVLFCITILDLFVPSYFEQSPFLRVGPGVALLGITVLAYTLECFPIRHLSHLPFQIDHPIFPYLIQHDLHNLSMGVLHGWNDNFLGGVPNLFLLMRTLVFAFLPFAIFGMRVGYNLMMMAGLVAFPFLVRWWVLLETRSQRTALIAGWGAIALLPVFYQIMFRATISYVFSVDLIVLNMCLLRQGADKKYCSLWLLFVSLSVLLTLYIGHFVASCIILCAYAIGLRLGYNTKLPLGRIAFGTILSLMMVSPFLYPLLKYHGYLLPSNLFIPLDADMVHRATMARTGVLSDVPRVKITLKILLSFVPLLYCVLSRHRGNVVLKAICAFFFLLFCFTDLGLFFKRLFWASPIFAAALIGVVISERKNNGMGERVCMALVMVFILVNMFLPHEVRYTDGPDFDPALTKTIRSFPEPRILLENRTAFNPKIDLKEPFEEVDFNEVTNWEGYLVMATHKDFLATYGAAPHPFNTFRETYLVNGVLQGRDLSSFPVDEIVTFFHRWAVLHAVVWSETARNYFLGYPEQFMRVGDQGMWTIFSLRGADIRMVTVGQGSGTLETLSPLRKRLVLNGVKANDVMVVRINYFPHWKATGSDGELEVLNVHGQLGVRLERDGDYQIDLIYPRDTLLLCLAGFSLLCTSMLAWREARRSTYIVENGKGLI